MKKRKFGLLISSVVATGAILAACGSDDDASTDTSNNDTTGNNDATEEVASDALTIAMVTDIGGVDDKSFNQSAWEGMQEWGAANGLKEGDGGYAYLQSQTDADYNPNLNKLIRRDFDLIFGVGYLMGDAITEVAEENPDKYLAIIDAEAKVDNVASILFKEQEGAFLAGVVAASMSESGKIGFVGGAEIPVIERFEAGFIEGAKAINPDIEIQINYTGVFDDASKGKIAANAMYSAGVVIIFHAAGATGNGVFAEAKERKEKDSDANIWVIGVDADQYEEGQVGDQNVTLTSMLKGVGLAVQDISDRAKAGDFPGGETIVYGLAENGVGLADSRGAIPQEVLDKVEEYKAKIASGEITVPETVEK